MKIAEPSAPVLVCGSLAYDTVIVYNDKLKFNGAGHKADVYFIVPDLQRGFGGCAGNIAYNLKLLGKTSYPVGTVGTDFGTYAEWLGSCGISCEYIKQIEHNLTAQSFVLQDANDNRVTAFHPGAMNFSHFNRLPRNRAFAAAVLAPDGFDGMLIHMRQLAEANLPMLFYPGIGMLQMHGDDLLGFIEQARWMVLDENEKVYVEKYTGLGIDRLAERLDALVINCGQDGALIYANGARHQIPGCKPRQIHDLTGCDDAFCAGLLYGLLGDIDWETTGRIATLMWSIKAEHHGTQRHSFTFDNFKALYRKVFGYALIA
jgi:adenosine kinase